MPAPITLMLRKGLHAVTQKLVAEVLVSSLSTLLVMTLISHLTRPAPALAPADPRVATADLRAAPDAASDATADFLERVALSHVAAPKAAQDALADATAEPAAVTPVPVPPRRHAAAPDPSRPGKDRVAAIAPGNIQGNPQANVPGAVVKAASPQPAQSASAAAAPAAGGDWLNRLNPLNYGAGLVANIGDFVSASDKRVVAGMASVGDSVTTFVKKLKS